MTFASALGFPAATAHFIVPTANASVMRNAACAVFRTSRPNDHRFNTEYGKRKTAQASGPRCGARKLPKLVHQILVPSSTRASADRNGWMSE